MGAVHPVDETPAVTIPGVRRVLACGAAIVVVDAFLLGLPMVAAPVMLWMLFIALPLTLRGKYAGVRAQRLRNIGIYIGAVVIAVAYINVNNNNARQRAGPVIAAVEAYQAKHRRYPETLEALVPQFLPAIPRARFTWMAGDYVYRNRDGMPYLMYSRIPPYSVSQYDFGKGVWIDLDD